MCARARKCACVCTRVGRTSGQFATAGLLMNEGISIADAERGAATGKATHRLGAAGNGASMVETIKLPGL